MAGGASFLYLDPAEISGGNPSRFGNLFHRSDLKVYPHSNRLFLAHNGAAIFLLSIRVYNYRDLDSYAPRRKVHLLDPTSNFAPESESPPRWARMTGFLCCHQSLFGLEGHSLTEL